MSLCLLTQDFNGLLSKACRHRLGDSIQKTRVWVHVSSWGCVGVMVDDPLLFPEHTLLPGTIREVVVRCGQVHGTQVSLHPHGRLWSGPWCPALPVPGAASLRQQDTSQVTLPPAPPVFLSLALSSWCLCSLPMLCTNPSLCFSPTGYTSDLDSSSPLQLPAQRAARQLTVASTCVADLAVRMTTSIGGIMDLHYKGKETCVMHAHWETQHTVVAVVTPASSAADPTATPPTHTWPLPTPALLPPLLSSLQFFPDS